MELTPLEEQLVNELKALLRQLNDKYKDFIHLNVLTTVALPDEQMCNGCKTSEFKPFCKRAVIGIHADENLDDRQNNPS